MFEEVHFCILSFALYSVDITLHCTISADSEECGHWFCRVELIFHTGSKAVMGVCLYTLDEQATVFNSCVGW